LLRNTERETVTYAPREAGRYGHSKFQERGDGDSAANANGESRATGRSGRSASRSGGRCSALGDANEFRQYASGALRDRADEGDLD